MRKLDYIRDAVRKCQDVYDIYSIDVSAFAWKHERPEDPIVATIEEKRDGRNLIVGVSILHPYMGINEDGEYEIMYEEEDFRFTPPNRLKIHDC